MAGHTAGRVIAGDTPKDAWNSALELGDSIVTKSGEWGMENAETICQVAGLGLAVNGYANRHKGIGQ
jgi:hypothetical protein